MDDKNTLSEQLSAYLDGELSDAQRRRVEAALRDDPALARELEALRAARELLRSLPTAKAPDNFAAAVMDKAERLQLVAPTPQTRRWRFHWASLATAAVVLIAVGIGVVVTVRLTLTPSWPDRFAREKTSKHVALAPPATGELKEARGSHPMELAQDRDLTGRELAAGTPAELRSYDESAGQPLNVVEGTAGISPGLAASAHRAGDQVGKSNVAAYRFEAEESDKGPEIASERRRATSASGPARGVQDIGVMPPIAAAPGPRADRPAGVVTQVGEPLYHGSGRMQDERAATSGPAMAMGGSVTSRYNDALQPAVARERTAGSFSLRGTIHRLLDGKGAKEEAPSTASLVLTKPAGGPVPATSAPAQPTSAPASAPASQPTSHPASQPSSQPASQPTSQPATQPASAPAAEP